MKKISIYYTMLMAMLIGLAACTGEYAMPPIVLPEGAGTKDDPYSVPAAIMRARANGETSTDYVFTKGYVKSGSIDTSFGNATWIISDNPDGSGATIKIYHAKDFDNEKFSDANKVKIGDEIVVYAPLIYFRGNTPETNGGYLYSINGVVGSYIPDLVGDPIAAGDGTLESPYNPDQANEVASALKDGEVSDYFYIEGYVSSVKEISTSYGNASFYITTAPGGSNPFYVYRTKGWNGDKVSDEKIVRVGYRVLLKAKLVNYQGNTPETQQNSGSIISINGESK